MNFIDSRSYAGYLCTSGTFLEMYCTIYDSRMPLKLSRHNFHETTWGHRLQYDRFRTTLNKN